MRLAKLAVASVSPTVGAVRSNVSRLIAVAKEMATADVTIGEVEELVEPGQLGPDHIVTPGIFVRHIFQGGPYERRIERRTVRA